MRSASLTAPTITVGLALSLSGCLAGLPPADQVQLTAPAGVELPYKARVMVFAGESELQRNLTIQTTAFLDKETNVKDGLALARAARAVLAKGFERVEINDPSLRPQIVVKLLGKVTWSQVDARMKLGCAIDAWTTDGIPLGNFSNRIELPRADYRSDIEPAYAHCLIKPAEALLASPALTRLAGAGFRDPPPAATASWLRSLGPIPALR